MEKTKNKKVQEFLKSIVVTNDEKYHTLIEIREVVFKIYPETKEKIMYGGIVFFLNDEMFSGIFINKYHVTIEFSKGFVMRDPNNRLEGNGKYRRHIKIKKREDITLKKIAFFVKQAV